MLPRAAAAMSKYYKAGRFAINNLIRWPSVSDDGVTVDRAIGHFRHRWLV